MKAYFKAKADESAVHILNPETGRGLILYVSSGWCKKARAHDATKKEIETFAKDGYRTVEVPDSEFAKMYEKLEKFGKHKSLSRNNGQFSIVDFPILISMAEQEFKGVLTITERKEVEQ